MGSKIPIGQYVNKRRKALGFTQFSLSRLIGYTPQALSKFEKSSIGFGADVYPIIANAIQISVNDLFDRKEFFSQLKEGNKLFTIPQIGVALRTIRKTYHLTQEDFAKILSVHPRSIRNYEAGNSVPSIVLFEKMLCEFNLCPTDFVEIIEGKVK